MRTPSLKKRFAARTSLKRMVRAKVRMPRGSGFLTNPRRAGYNAIYNRTSFSIDRIGKGRKMKSSKSSSTGGGKCLLITICIIFLPFIWPFLLIYLLYKLWRKNS